MENAIIVPFDLNTAKKINIGERVGQIVTEKGRNRAEIVYEDNSSICPLLVVIHSISVSACSNGTLWDYCIHFEGNECLLGTTENPEK